MPSPEQTLRVYEDLAQWYEAQGQAKLRDWFLVLAADTALASGRPDEAERLRGRLLTLNPHHLLRPFGSFAEAVQSPDVQGYVADLRRTYPPATAEQLLQSHRGKAAEAEDWPPRLSTPPAPEPVSTPAPKPDPEVKVYRIQSDVEEPRPSPAAPVVSAPPKPAPKPPAPPRTPPAKPTRAPAAPLVKEPARKKAPAAAGMEGESERAVNRWVALALFVVLLLGALALAGYLVVRPFLAG